VERLPARPPLPLLGRHVPYQRHRVPSLHMRLPERYLCHRRVRHGQVRRAPTLPLLPVSLLLLMDVFSVDLVLASARCALMRGRPDLVMQAVTLNCVPLDDRDGNTGQSQAARRSDPQSAQRLGHTTPPCLCKAHPHHRPALLCLDVTYRCLRMLALCAPSPRPHPLRTQCRDCTGCTGTARARCANGTCVSDYSLCPATVMCLCEPMVRGRGKVYLRWETAATPPGI